MSLHARAPLRIDFAGGWSDNVAFADREGGCVVNAAIAAYVHVDLLTEGKTIQLHSDDLPEHVTISSSGQIVYDGKLDRHKAALNMLPMTGGIEVLSRSDMPLGSGLGEAAALDVALVAGLARGRLEEYDADELVELGIMLDSVELGLSGRRQDHCAAVFGGFHELNFLDERIERRRIAVSEDAAVDLANHLVLVYTGQSHFSTQTDRRVWDAYASGDGRVVGAIRGMRDVARKVGPILEASDWEALAALVNRNWEYQQLLDATMSTPRTRSVEEAIRAAGALGLKAMGEAAGGCLLVVCPVDRHEPVAEAARAKGCTVLDFSFSFDGVTIWEQDDVSGNT